MYLRKKGVKKPSLEQSVSKGLNPMERVTAEQFMKNCSPREGLTLENLVLDCPCGKDLMLEQVKSGRFPVPGDE